MKWFRQHLTALPDASNLSHKPAGRARRLHLGMGALMLLIAVFSWGAAALADDATAPDDHSAALVQEVSTMWDQRVDGYNTLLEALNREIPVYTNAYADLQDVNKTLMKLRIANQQVTDSADVLRERQAADTRTAESSLAIIRFMALQATATYNSMKGDPILTSGYTPGLTLPQVGQLASLAANQVKAGQVNPNLRLLVHSGQAGIDPAAAKTVAARVEPDAQTVLASLVRLHHGLLDLLHPSASGKSTAALPGSPAAMAQAYEPRLHQNFDATMDTLIDLAVDASRGNSFGLPAPTGPKPDAKTIAADADHLRSYIGLTYPILYARHFGPNDLPEAPNP